LGGWLTANPDCALEAGSIALSYGLSGAPNVLSLTGATGAGVDAGFLAKECLDRNPRKSPSETLDFGRTIMIEFQQSVRY